MAVLELAEIQIQRREIAADEGATTLSKDILARHFNGKTIHAVGTVEDVVGKNEDLTVLLGTEGEVLQCPLVRVHGRSMEDTIRDVATWRKGDLVEVTGKLTWPIFSDELRIDILSVAKAGAAT